MKTLAYCFNCQKEHDISNIEAGKKGLKCECGGYVISPSGKVQIKLIPENNKDRRLLNMPIVVYQIIFNNYAGWYTENPKDFKEEIEAFVNEEGWNINIDDCISCIQALNVGEKYEVEQLVFKCVEMSDEKYKSLPEFTGW